MENKMIIDPNKFMHILFASGIDIEIIRDSSWKWEIIEKGVATYYIVGCHPVAARIGLIKSGIVIH